MMNKHRLSAETLSQIVTSSDECQEYLNTVVGAWKVLRQGNITNAERAQHLEQRLQQHTKELESILNEYDRLDLELSKTQSLIIATNSLNDSINQLFDQTNKLELIRDKLMASKNQYLIDTYEQQKRKEYEKVRDKFRTEYLNTRKSVESQRQRAIEKALTTHKQMLQDEYERELRKFVRTTISEDDDAQPDIDKVQGIQPTSVETLPQNPVPPPTTPLLSSQPIPSAPATTISITPSLLTIPSPNISNYSRVNGKEASEDAFDLYNDEGVRGKSKKGKKAKAKSNESKSLSSRSPPPQSDDNKKTKTKSGKEILDMYLDPSNMPTLGDIP